jgi:Cys-tRNA(Pro) deacylase
MVEKPSSIARVQQALDRSGLRLEAIELPRSTRTAQQAAEAVGSELGQIVKSLVLQGSDSGNPYLVLVSGPNRADMQRVGALVGESVQMAQADFVRQVTGFSIGGVAPVGLSSSIPTLIDEDFLQYDLVWAAAGTPHSVFSLTPQDLVKLTGGRLARVS